MDLTLPWAPGWSEAGGPLVTLLRGDESVTIPRDLFVQQCGHEPGLLAPVLHVPEDLGVAVEPLRRVIVRGAFYTILAMEILRLADFFQMDRLMDGVLQSWQRAAWCGLSVRQADMRFLDNLHSEPPPPDPAATLAGRPSSEDGCRATPLPEPSVRGCER